MQVSRGATVWYNDVQLVHYTQVYYNPKECSYERLLQEFFNKVRWKTDRARSVVTKCIIANRWTQRP